MFTPATNTAVNTLPRPDAYVVYGWQRSYFTHKLMAALRFYGADWSFREKTRDNADEVRLRADTHQIPVLHTPENWMIADTTPLLHLLDGRFPNRRLFPAGPLGLLVQIVEEYFDEWIARTTVHWRWNYPENHDLLALDAAHGDADIARSMIEWGAKVCRATGVSSAVQKAAAEAEYHRILEAVEAQLAETPYLLGDRPTAVDCIVLAGLRAHFLYDPAPKRALHDRYPAAVRWAEADDTAWDGTGHLADVPDSTPFARFVLAEMKDTYGPFALGNRDALAAGSRAFVIPMYGEDVSYLARPYVEQSRRMIADRIDRELAGDARARFDAWLDSVGLKAMFA
ncbi:MAG: glutathione S-transferase family protein [Rhodobacterales bacterium]|nr:glutathione S-transferase family protein [Rhodobacterales bacterium]